MLTDTECTPPWAHTWKPDEVMLLTDHGASHRDAIAPFVLSRPQWLVAADGEVELVDAYAPMHGPRAKRVRGKK